MRYLAAILLICSCASADEIFKPTGRYAKPAPPATTQWFLASEEWCVNCPAGKDKFKAKEDIQAITGATITSQGVADGVKKALTE